jgi:hypothetical protein
MFALDRLFSFLTFKHFFLLARAPYTVLYHFRSFRPAACADQAIAEMATTSNRCLLLYWLSIGLWVTVACYTPFGRVFSSRVRSATHDAQIHKTSLSLEVGRHA